MKIFDLFYCLHTLINLYLCAQYSIESYLKNILYLGFPGVVYINEAWLDCSIVTLFSQILVKILKQRLIILSEIWGRLTWSGPAGFPDMDRAEGDPTDYSNDRKLCSASGP